MNWQDALGRPVSATDQPPGTYRYRARRGAPLQPVLISWDGDLWHVLLNGEPVPHSGQLDPMEIPFVLFKGPFPAITPDEYRCLIMEHEMAGPGSPLRTPDQAVNLRRAVPL
jgi:hypothetical protein